MVARRTHAPGPAAARAVQRVRRVDRRAFSAAPTCPPDIAHPRSLAGRKQMHRAEAALPIAFAAPRFVSHHGETGKLECRENQGESHRAARNQLASSVAGWLTNASNGRSASRPAVEPQIR